MRLRKSSLRRPQLTVGEFELHPPNLVYYPSYADAIQILRSPRCRKPNKISDFVKAKQVISKICQCAHWYIFEISPDKPAARYAARVLFTILKNLYHMVKSTSCLSEPPSVRTGLFSFYRQWRGRAKKEIRYVEP